MPADAINRMYAVAAALKRAERAAAILWRSIKRHLNHVSAKKAFIYTRMIWLVFLLLQSKL